MRTDITTHRGGFHLEVICVVGVRHQIAVVGALQLEAVCDASIRVAILAVAVEVDQTFIVAEFLEVLVVLGYSSIAQEFHHTCIIKGLNLNVDNNPLVFTKDLNDSKMYCVYLSTRR